MKPVVWGVISTPKIGRERVLPGMKTSSLLEIRAIASRTQAAARKTADALGIPADACVFVDDLKENVAGAEAVGMTALLHRDSDETVAALSSLFALELSASA